MIKLIHIFLISLLFFSFIESEAQTLKGTWEGKLDIAPTLSLRIGLNIEEGADEVLKVTMDSPDQGAYGIPMEVLFIDSDSLFVQNAQIGAKYRGRLIQDSVMGIFEQSVLKIPVTMKRKSVNRPQTPRPPFPYKEEEVEFKSISGDATLYGTLTLPAHYTADTPVAILVTGSGVQNRDEEIFDHKPFAVMADYLARNGVATLRYDDRGFDPSKGFDPNPTTLENAKDAEGAILYLRDKGFKKIGIIGHSEGGLIADMIAAGSEDLSFVIEIGGPTVSGDEILIYQNETLLKDGGMPENIVSMYIDAMKGYFNRYKGKKEEPFDESQYEIFSAQWQSNPVVAPLVKNLRNNFSEMVPWLSFFVSYDPMTDIEMVKIPMLMLYGNKDTQVPPALNIPPIQNRFDNMTIKVYDDLNHLMQKCKTGRVNEYAEIEETICPDVLDDIKDFILAATGKVK